MSDEICVRCGHPLSEHLRVVWDTSVVQPPFKMGVHVCPTVLFQSAADLGALQRRLAALEAENRDLAADIYRMVQQNVPPSTAAGKAAVQARPERK